MDSIIIAAQIAFDLVLGWFGCVFLFQDRRGFTRHDNFMSNIVGETLVLGAIVLLAWTWFR